MTASRWRRWPVALFESWFVDFDPVRAKARGAGPWAAGASWPVCSRTSFEDVAALGDRCRRGGGSGASLRAPICGAKMARRRIPIGCPDAGVPPLRHSPRLMRGRSRSAPPVAGASWSLKWTIADAWRNCGTQASAQEHYDPATGARHCRWPTCTPGSNERCARLSSWSIRARAGLRARAGDYFALLLARQPSGRRPASLVTGRLNGTTCGAATTGDISRAQRSRALRSRIRRVVFRADE